MKGFFVIIIILKSHRTASTENNDEKETKHIKKHKQPISRRTYV